ncbi:metallophosphoesterase [Vampirovibrio chlorellavorus]|uniref:metallophosphoesterase n=1 Tax=Vampirovibrio chlorellavorus TaxID=758823 RepID=UPI0026EBDE94|nr:metallophosphoesterase [Vampirovibrio chlorellavorus]
MHTSEQGGPASPEGSDCPPVEKLKAYIVSDVHLNNHPFDAAHLSENPRRRNFRLFLRRLNEELQANERIQLILNGDILDITGSWFESVMPWDGDRSRVLDTLNRLLLDIMENNLSTFEELRRLLRHPYAEIIYVFGNHDGMLQQYPESHAVVKTFLCPEAEGQSRIRFVPCYASEELDLYLEHGHLQDPFNRQCDQHEPPLGDVINVLIVNRFVELAVNRFREHGYSEPFITRIHSRLHDIEYLRPLALLPVWIQTIGYEYEGHPESRGKIMGVPDILMAVIAEILRDPDMVAYMTRRLQWPRPMLPLMVKLILRIPWILPVISFFTSKLMRRTHSNKYQYKAAQKIHREKGYRLIAFGHTHIPGVQPLSQSAYYFNTGSWKPVINLFKISKDPVELEYLNPDVQFNKVERSGILLIEKSDRSSPAEFSLQTIQSGLG